jgi:hypothetical protein
MIPNKIERLMQLANPKRYLFVTSQAKVVVFAGDFASPNAQWFRNEMRGGGTGPFTIEEAREESRRIAAKRKRELRAFERHIDFNVETAPMADGDISPFYDGKAK